MKIDTLLFCNKLKQLGCDATIIKEAIKDSNLVELCEDQISIRRKEAYVELPVVKKVKTEGQ